MKKLVSFICFILISSQLTFAQKNNKLTYGSIKDSVYTNSFFGLTVNIPHGWAIQSQEHNKKLKEYGKEFIDAEGNKEVAIDASVERSSILLNTSKYEAGAPVDFNPNLIVLVENIDLSPGIKNGKDYLFHAKKFMTEHSKLSYTIKPGFEPVTIDEQQFYIMEATAEVGAKLIRQTYYVTIINKYALIVIATEDNADPDADLASLVKNNIKFSL